MDTNAAQILPYITSLGLFFVLLGFATLVWTRACYNRFPFLAIACFVIGLSLAGGSLFGETYYETIDMSHAPIVLSQKARSAIHTCEMGAKSAYIAALSHANIHCTADSTGWPNRACVTGSNAGALLYEKLHHDENQCYEANR